MATRVNSTQAFWRVAAAAALIVSAVGVSAQVVNDDCGDAGGGGGDIERLSAMFDPVMDELVVDVKICGPLNPSTKYRLRIDHFVDQQEYPAGSGNFVDATLLDGNPYCLGVGDV